ncbi:ATP-binding protein [Streptomyces sp. NPDC056638]|uniref:ATP-binding protein n=1 Tax=Streptomyces sp. NPDC056638 TaxID=3345887 RepID=UPI0036AC3083
MTCTYASEAPPRQGPTRSPVGTWTLAHRPEAAGEARKITKELLTRWSVAEDAADSVLLTVSELVTNAVEHARPPLHFALSRDPGTQRVHIEVSDGGPAAMDGDWAASCTPDEHGRGLAIVDQLTAAHGDREEPGRAVHWADVTRMP